MLESILRAVNAQIGLYSLLLKAQDLRMYYVTLRNAAEQEYLKKMLKNSTSTVSPPKSPTKLLMR